MQEEHFKNNNYTSDLLGNGFEKLILHFPDDYEGKVIATLIRKCAEKDSQKAILYIHGFNDYFFQKEMAQKFNDQGYNFYALDLRKYGRSYLSHQKFNNVRSIREYDEELNLALQIIKSENNNQVLLMGHSNGGLITTNFAMNHLNSTLFHGLIGNSPFYEFNLNYLERSIGIPILSFLGKYFPDTPISGGFSENYGYSLQKDKHGEWDYSLIWKPYNIQKVNLGFIRAIHKAQKNCRQKQILAVPTLILHSSQTISEKHWSDKFKEGDAVLNIHHIKKYAHKLQGKVTVTEIKNGLHDLILSKKPIREKVYKVIFDWINTNFNKTH
ncbi:alpha/beta hydrolase [Cellulophaga sp. L1A9]|uniref:alpha/beta hydrolase n=1 Tax=Cellulophaga sp. L1A9 TaxID=2686362 RepID=UPI00131DAA16|nr:alpha/beta hydrolase [Cellulophaga sp. L1A9]